MKDLPVLKHCCSCALNPRLKCTFKIILGDEYTCVDGHLGCDSVVLKDSYQHFGHVFHQLCWCEDTQILEYVFAHCSVILGALCNIARKLPNLCALHSWMYNVTRYVSSIFTEFSHTKYLCFLSSKRITPAESLYLWLSEVCSYLTQQAPLLLASETHSDFVKL